MAADHDRHDDDLRWLAAGGDVFLCRDLPGFAASAGAAAPLAGVAPLFRAADIALVNLEAVLAHGGAFARKNELRPFYFHAPPETLNVLVAAGVSAVTAANNHAGDFGPDALAEQCDLLEAHGLPMAGAGRSLAEAERPVLLEANGLTVALLAFTTRAPGFAAGDAAPGTFFLRIDGQAMDRLAPRLAQARAAADIVVVSPHWGPNWRTRPNKGQRRLARALIEAGADAVLGHSAHVLHGVELHAGRPIVYDMGTLIADRIDRPDMARSALVRLGFDATGVRRLAIRPMTLAPCTANLAHGDAAAEIRAAILGRSEDFDRIPAWRSDGEELVADLAPPRRRTPLVRRRPRPAPASPGAALPVHARAAIRPVAPAPPPAPSFAVPGALPPELAGTAPRDMGGGFVVHGQRHAKRVAPRHGFLVEVLFACPAPRGRPWRASLRVDPLELRDGKPARGFRYRHPVAEGLWLPQAWDGAAILRDAFVARPPEDWLTPGTWRLRWTLVDAETGRIWPASDTEPAAGWAELGTIALTEDAPRGVAGVDWGCDAGWRGIKS